MNLNSDGFLPLRGLKLNYAVIWEFGHDSSQGRRSPMDTAVGEMQCLTRLLGSCRGSESEGTHRCPVPRSPRVSEGRGTSERCRGGPGRAVLSRWVWEHRGRSRGGPGLSSSPACARLRRGAGKSQVPLGTAEEWGFDSIVGTSEEPWWGVQREGPQQSGVWESEGRMGRAMGRAWYKEACEK